MHNVRIKMQEKEHENVMKHLLLCLTDMQRSMRVL